MKLEKAKARVRPRRTALAVLRLEKQAKIRYQYSTKRCGAGLGEATYMAMMRDWFLFAFGK